MRERDFLIVGGLRERETFIGGGLYRDVYY